MTKKFYTEKDIEDLVRSGAKSLRVDQDVALTELAYEKAKRLGLSLLTDLPDNPPSAPVRPYLSDARTAPAAPKAAPVSPAFAGISQGTQPKASGLENRIRAAVIARLGNQVEAKLLDTIIHRVLKATGMK